MLPDLDRVTELLREVAQSVILPKFRALSEDEVRRKQAGELVTVADIEAEKYLTPRLRALLPGSQVVGEEAVSADPSLLDLLEADGPVWLVDPIDGTKNFADGKPKFAVMVGLLVAGRCMAGWIHDPLSGQTIVAAEGQGTHRNGEILKVDSSKNFSELQGVLNLGYFERDKIERIRARRHLLGKVESQRCAGHEYIGMASGLTHFALFNRTKPWDHAAGDLIHREAGGVSRRLDGREYLAADRTRGLLAAPDAEAWEALYRFLMEA